MCSSPHANIVLPSRLSSSTYCQGLVGDSCYVAEILTVEKFGMFRLCMNESSDALFPSECSESQKSIHGGYTQQEVYS